MSYQPAQTNAVALREPTELQGQYEPGQGPLSAQEIKAQVQLIQEVMQAVMQEGFHYGTLPGTDRPSLLKPGAEKLTTTFRLAPLLHIETRDLGGGHREYEVRCTLQHIPTGRIYGEGVGSCSTLESKYRYRQGERVCPNCGNTTIIKGRVEYGGGWLCFQKKGGCGAKFTDIDPTIASQQVGRTEHPDIADLYNTVLKMGKKRALIDATLTVTAASDIFTQDLEDMPPEQKNEPDRPLTIAPKPEPLHTSPQRQSAPSPQGHPPTGQGKPLSKAQQDILALTQRRAKVTDARLALYLAETFKATLKELQQKDLNTVLAWLTSEEEKEEAKRAQPPVDEGQPQQPTSSQPFAFQPEVLYLGEIKALAPSVPADAQKGKSAIPGRIVLQTEHGPLSAQFFSRPEALKQVQDWDSLIGLPAQLSYYERKDTSQRTYWFVKDFSVAPQPAPDNPQDGAGDAQEDDIP